MVDKKVYKTDYQSEFTEFFEKLDVDSETVGVTEEREIYDEVIRLRDTKGVKNSRNKLWEKF